VTYGLQSLEYLLNSRCSEPGAKCGKASWLGCGSEANDLGSNVGSHACFVDRDKAPNFFQESFF
jgi:hypothetical protein